MPLSWNTNWWEVQVLLTLESTTDYYNSALLAQLKTWFTPEYTCLWFSIETSQVPDQDLDNWQLSSPWVNTQNTNLSPTIVASKLAFNYLLTNAPKGAFSHIIPLTISMLSIFLPNLSTWIWLDKGIWFVSDLYSNNLLRPFTAKCLSPHSDGLLKIHTNNTLSAS